MNCIFSKRQIVKALNQNKTVINFQYIDGEGCYIGNGSLDDMFLFAADAIAKMCVQAGNQLNTDDVKKILTSIRKRSLKTYDRFRGCVQ